MLKKNNERLVKCKNECFEDYITFVCDFNYISVLIASEWTTQSRERWKGGGHTYCGGTCGTSRENEQPT